MKNMEKFAEHIIAIANKNDEYITNLKLQKVMYIAMKNTKTDLKFLANLYDEPFEVWRYGPTVRCIYDKYKEFVTTPIRFNEAKRYTEYDIFNKEIIRLLDENVWDLIDLCTREDFYEENKKHIISSTSNIIYPLHQIIKSTLKRIPFLDEGLKFVNIPDIEEDKIYETTEIKQLNVAEESLLDEFMKQLDCSKIKEKDIGKVTTYQYQEEIKDYSLVEIDKYTVYKLMNNIFYDDFKHLDRDITFWGKNLDFKIVPFIEDNDEYFEFYFKVIDLKTPSKQLEKVIPKSLFDEVYGR